MGKIKGRKILGVILFCFVLSAVHGMPANAIRNNLYTLAPSPKACFLSTTQANTAEIHSLYALSGGNKANLPLASIPTIHQKKNDLKASLRDTVSNNSYLKNSGSIFFGFICILASIFLVRKPKTSIHPCFLMLLLLFLFAFTKQGQAQSQTFSASGTFTPPAGVTSVTVEAWGGGGGGAAVSHAAGGGGGGAYTKGTLNNLVPGTGVPVTVGAGGVAGDKGKDSKMETITANGGSAGNVRTGGAGGTASVIGGLIIASFAGGAGGNAMGSTAGVNDEGGGGGGGSAFSSAKGNNGATATSATGGAGGTGTGAGGRGADGDALPDAVAGTVPGGGGGGRGEAASTSKDGANGRVIVSWVCPEDAGVISSTKTNICTVGGTAQLSSTVPGGVWSSSDDAIAEIDPTTGEVTAKSSGGGTVKMTYTIPAFNGCPLRTASFNLIVENLTTVSAGPAMNSICQGATSDPLGGTFENATTAVWSDGGAGGSFLYNTGTTPNTARYVASATSPASVTLTLTASGSSCGPASITKNITVNPTIGNTTFTAGKTTVCQNDPNETYTATAANSTSITYSVSPATAGSIHSSTGVMDWNAAFSGTATITATATGCGTTSATRTVTVNPTTGITSFTAGATTICQGAANETYTAAAANSTSMAYSVSPVAAGSIHSSTGVMDWNAAFSGTATITATATGLCGTTSATRTVTVNPTTGATSFTAGATTICQNAANETYTATAANSTSITYSVSPAAAGSINSATGVMDWNAAFSGTATITATATGLCGTTSATRTVTVNPSTGATSFTAGATTICQGAANETYTATAANSTSMAYSVSPAAAGSINSSTGVMDWNAAFSGMATITATATGLCGTTSATRTVTVNPTIGVTSFTAGATTICQNAANETYTATAANSTSMAYSVSPATAGSINSSTGVMDWNAAFSGTATITATATGLCGTTSATRTVTINPSTGVTSFTAGATTICQGAANETYTATAANSTSMAYSVSPVAAGSIHSSTGVMDWNAAFSGTATITATATGLCGTTSNTRTVTVHPTPTVTSPGNQTYCQGDPTNPIALTGTPSGVVFDITGGAGIGLANQSGVTVLPSFTPLAGTATITLTPRANGCSGTPMNFSITVHETPTLTGASQQGAVCAGFPATINLTGLKANSTNTIAYSINGIAQTPVTGVAANVSGNGSFTTTALTGANNGQTLQVTGVTITSNTPNCSKAFTQNVTLTVNSAPVFTTCPSALNLSSSAGACTALGTYSAVASGVTAPTYTYTFTGATTGSGNGTGSGATFNPGTTHVKVTATNSCGSVDCTFDIVVADDVPPVISNCPSNITVYSGAGNTTCDQAATWTEPGAVDNCTPAANLVWVKSHSPGTVFPVGTTTVTYSVKDAKNNSTPCSFTVTVVDDTPPVFTPPSAVTIYSNASCTASRLPAITGTVTVKSDNCTAASSLVVGFTDAPNVAGACTGSYSFTRTWTVTDLSGNSASGTQVITVSDNIKPSLTVPPAKAITCTESQLPANTGQATATDNCSGAVTITYTDVAAAGSCAGNSTITRTWKATDCSGNFTTANQVITITDNQAPSVTIKNLTVATPDVIPAEYTTLAAFQADGGTAVDNCGTVSIVLWSEVANGLEGKPGYCPTSITRTYRFTDQCGNFVDRTQTIAVQSDGGCSKCTSGTTFEYVDLMGMPTGSLVFSNLQRNGKCCNATGSDDCISFNVRIDDDAVGVEILIDGATPSSQDWRIDCNPINMTDGMVCMPGGDFHLFTFCKPGGNKNTYTFRSIPGVVTSEGISTRVECSGQITTSGILSGATWNSISPGAPGQYNSYLSSTTIANPIFTAGPNAPSVIKYEVCGNIGTTVCNSLGRDCAVVTVNVKPKIALTLNVNPTMTCLNNPLVLVADINPSSNYSYEWHTGQGATSTPALSTSKTLTLQPPVALGWYSLKVTDIDANGIACSTSTFDFQVQADLTGPSVLVPPSGDLTINCNNPNANALIQNWLASAVATDEAGNPLTVSHNYTGIDLLCGTVLPVTFSATDHCGNVNTAIANIRVIDNVGPTWVTAAGSLNRTVECSDASALLAAQALAPTSVDVCDLTVTITKTSGSFVAGSCPLAGTITNTWTATDDCGNVSAVFSQVITITDTQAPVWITAAGNLDRTVSCSDAAGLAAARALAPVATDLCDGSPSLTKVSGAFVSGGCGGAGTYTNTWTARDACNNTSTVYTQVITVSQATVPTMTAPADITVACNAIPAPSTIPFTNGESGGCLISGTSATSTFSALPGSCGGTITETWTATDACGRALAPVSRTITVNPPALPTMTAPAPITIACGASLPAPSTITYTNGASGTCLISGTSDASTFSAMPAGACGGTVTETWTATDACGRALAPVTRTITISPAALPTMTAPADITVACGAVPAPSTIPYTNGETGGCLISGTSNLSTLSVQSPAGACGGTIIETWTATDACGRALAPVTRTITVSPATLPTMTAPAPLTRACGAALPAPSRLPYTNGGAAGCLLSGNSNLSTFSAMPPDACGGTVTETWTATDACGRALAPVTRTITISPAPLPVMTAPAAITLACGDPLPAPSTRTFTNSRPGGCLITGTSNPSTFSAMPAGACGGTVTETWTATDDCGRALAPVTRTITISPAALPVMTPPEDITVDCGGRPAASTIPYSNGLSGNCLISGTSNLSTFSTQTPAGACGGTIIETWTARDACGRNLVSVSRTITVRPAAEATIAPQSNITVACGALPAPSTKPYNNGGAGACRISGNSNLSTFTADPGACGGTVTETWTATDACGRVLPPVSRTITVTPATLPVMTAPAAITLACGDPLPAPSTITYTNSRTGGCLITGTSNPSTFSAMPAGACGGTVTETWTATDACGRALAPVTRTITISPAALPVMTPPEDITVDCGSLPAPSTVPYTNGGAGGCLISGISGNSTFSVQSPTGACGGTVIETWRATDACGRVLAPVTRTITVRPAPEATIAAQPDITVACNAIPAPSTKPFTNGLTGACRINGTSNLSTLSANPGSCGGTMTETWTGTDACGRALTPVTRTITITPATLPTMTAPAAITLACGDPLPAPSTLTYSNSGAGGCLITGTSNPSTFSAMPAGACGGTVTETWTATDDCGRVLAPVSRTITISPAALPVMTPPEDITVDCGSLPAPSTVPYTNGGAGGCLISGVSGNSTFSVQSPTGACGGTVIETWRATDACGRVLAPVTRTITVRPAALPVMTAPADITLSCGSAPVPSTRPFTNGLTGTCLISGTSNPSTFSAMPGTCSGTVTETWTATDACGRALTPITRTIQIVDNTAPVINTQAQNGSSNCVSVDPDQDAGYLAWLASHGGATASDVCDSNLDWTDNSATQNWVLDLVNHTKKITITFTVTDDCGNSSATVPKTYTLNDNLPPVITFCPGNVSEEIAPDGCSKSNVSIGVPLYHDLCSTPGISYTLTGATVVNNTAGLIPSSQVFNLGKTTVTYTVSDDTGLSVTCSFEVWIKRLDIPVGVITCPADPAPVAAQNGICTAFVTVNAPTIVDLCPTASYTIVNDFNNTTNASGNYPVGTTIVTWTITDNSDNTNTSCKQTVIVNDTQAPQITCQDNVEETIPADNCSKTGVNIAPPVVTDNCSSPLLTWTLTGVTSGSGTGPIPASQVFNVGKTRVHYTVTDKGSLQDTCSFQVWIKHLNIPQAKIDCPASPAPVNAEPNKCTAFVTVNAPTIVDPCPTAGYTIRNSFNNSANASGDYPVGTTIVVWTITDNSDNTNTSCSQTVIVRDTQAPVITTCPADRNLVDCNTGVITGPALSTTLATSSYAEFSDAMNQGVATDQCGIVTVNYIDVISGTCPIVVTRTWTVIDGAGNMATCDQIITISDNTAPVVSCPVEGFITPSDFDLTFGTYSIPAFAYSDNCTSVDDMDISWTLSGATSGSGTGLIPTPYKFNTGVTTVSYVFKDLCGNATPCQFTVTALSPPNITCLADPKIYNTDAGECTHRLPTDANNPGVPTNNNPETLTWIWTIINPDGSTGATGTSIGVTAQPIDSYDFQLGTSTISWRVENESGHADCTHLVTVEDKQAPTFTASPVEFCVEPLTAVMYTGNVDDLDYDVNYTAADYRLFRASSPDLDVDLSTYDDNCCLLADGYTMRWTIDFEGSNSSEPSVSGTGQPSAYGTDIQLWGDGINFQNRVHTITYWITDCHGNESVANTVNITIKPRPKLIKINITNP